MRKKQGAAPSAVGSSSLLVIFAVLCFTVFGLLSLNTVLAEQRLVESSLESVTAYYAADAQAEGWFAALRSDPAAAEQVYSSSFPISSRQTLYVEVEKMPRGWRILRWQAVADPDMTEETLTLWEGQGKEDGP